VPFQFAAAARPNKCLAQSNKSGTGGEATKKRDAAHRAQPRHRQEGQARALPMAPMTEHDMIGWFNAAPMGSRQQRMLWAAHKIARLTGVTEGNVYQTLERSLERAGPPPSGSSVQRQRRVALGRLGSLAISRSRQHGMLPKNQRRNASRRHLSGTGSDHVDGRPDIGKKDRLLRRLIAVHGEPRFDLYRSRS
jgi:hypothetical protein